MNYYNEHDKFAAQWLRNLIAAGHIAPGIVDTRSIEDVRPEQLTQFTQCHFFAGIGVWSYALRLAGWPDDRPIWTGSCPCQPFSAAGKGAGFADERHLWPAFHWLIDQCRPPVVVGEQVASADGLGWLDLVLPDLEGSGYAVGAADLCAAGVGAPHIRQRLFWVADSEDLGPGGRLGGFSGTSGSMQRTAPGQGYGDAAWAHRAIGRLAHSSSSTGLPHGEPQDLCGARGRPEGRAVEQHGGAPACGLGHSERIGPGRHAGAGAGAEGGALVRPVGDDAGSPGANGRPGPTNGFWRAADWLACRDGKWRPVEPSTSPLVTGAPTRVGRLRGYGNALTAQAAEAFIRSVM